MHLEEHNQCFMHFLTSKTFLGPAFNENGLINYLKKGLRGFKWLPSWPPSPEIRTAHAKFTDWQKKGLQGLRGLRG